MIKANKGFSLVEVLITLSILTLVLTLSYQSLSVFLNAASKSRGDFNEAQSTSLLRVKLRASIRGMLDYYARNEDGHMRPYFIEMDSAIQYISVSPMVYSEQPEVLVTIKVIETETDENQRLEVWECPLRDQMPFSQGLAIISPNSKKCSLINNKISAETIAISVNRVNNDNSLSTLPGFGQIEDVLTFHLLPQFLTFTFVSSEREISWRFNTKIENRRKYFNMDGFDGNA